MGDRVLKLEELLMRQRESMRTVRSDEMALRRVKRLKLRDAVAKKRCALQRGSTSPFRPSTENVHLT